MTQKPRRWDTLCEDDPGAGLLNLFDVWIAFSVALLLALFSYLQNTTPHTSPNKDAGATTAAMEPLKNAMKAPHFRPTSSPMTGEGTRLGTAYRLQNGEVVYVPDEAVQADGVR